MSESQLPDQGPEQTEPSEIASTPESSPGFHPFPPGPKSIFECYNGVTNFNKAFHDKPNMGPWLPEDDTALKFVEDLIDEKLTNAQSSMKGVKRVEDIERVLELRWSKLDEHIQQRIERSASNGDKDKWSESYYTKQSEKVNLATREHHQGGGFIQIAKALALGKEANEEIWTDIETRSFRMVEAPEAAACSCVAKIGEDVIFLATHNQAKSDQNRWRPIPTYFWETKKYFPQAPELQESRALKNSEIVFQQLMQLFKDDAKQVEKLSIIWRFNIMNNITRRTIIKAHQAMGWTCSCWGKFKFDSNNAMERKQCQNLTATENGSVGMRLLADHPDIFDKEIKEILTFPTGSLPGVAEFHMVFRLGKRTDNPVE
jgi:hypothetical protein